MGHEVENQTIPIRLKWMGLAVIGMFMAWLQIEDVEVTYVIGLAAAGCGWLGMRYGYKKMPRLNVGNYKWIGMVFGIGVAPLAAFLMVFKGGLHAHGFQDFAMVQMLGVLRTTPVWGLVGMGLGIGAGMWVREQIGN